MLKKILKLVITIIFIAIILTLVLNMDKKYIDNDIVVTITQNSGAKSIANTLKSNGVIKSKFCFVNYVKKKNVSTKLKPGTYKFEKGIVTFDDILDKLMEGEQEKQVEVTIPEGYTVKQIASLFEEKGLFTANSFLESASNVELSYDYIAKTNDYNRLEGFLFPNTYKIPVSWKTDKIINMLVSEFNKHWTDEFENRAKELGYSVNEIITIASLIEREAKVDSERALISSVIHNRLKNNMLLQIDATIQYLLPEQKERLLYKDLEVDSPYNTYKYLGLPPTAIASPGISCIKAALYPESTKYYYYRTKASGNGEHYFAETFNQHVSYSEN